jgi:Ca-activated chloride channel family protein
MNAPQIILTPRRPAVLAGFQNTLDVLVRVAAPDATFGHSRAPLHLALVIDRSGSMAGQPEEAKKAAAFVINGLMRGDRASLVPTSATTPCLRRKGLIAREGCRPASRRLLRV